MAKTPSIPEAVAAKAIEQLRAALRKDGRADLAASLLIEAKRVYLYVAMADGIPLCRLRYTGRMDNWDLQMFKWSTEGYDTSGEFMFGGGTIEECIDAAIEGYGL
jgi:hypothetical protein